MLNITIPDMAAPQEGFPRSALDITDLEVLHLVSNIIEWLI